MTTSPDFGQNAELKDARYESAATALNRAADELYRAMGRSYGKYPNSGMQQVAQSMEAKSYNILREVVCEQLSSYIIFMKK